ncbi:MAG: dTDP-4-dehydrorhamnose reductase [Nitrosomonadales bacterium]|nr:dTDP-4-dehydrorhamnose reductase [Nitrosomonadales bacterium]
MDILLLGKDGQVGWELQRALSPFGHMVVPEIGECDLANPDQLRSVIRATKPALIVNAAAYTAVDKAESDADVARAVNAVAPGIMAEEARKLDAWLVHYSTDYVFDGSKAGAYIEEDVPVPLSVYGATKLQGEQAILETGCRHLIFRTSWVFAARGGNFARTMLCLARERDALTVVDDQFGAPTSAELIADITALCLRDVLRGGEAKQGLYHLVAAGETNWHGYARFVLEQAAQTGAALKCRPEDVSPIPTSAYPLPARRPANSRLDTSKLKREFDLYLPDWTYHAKRMLTEILAKERA